MPKRTSRKKTTRRPVSSNAHNIRRSPFIHEAALILGFGIFILEGIHYNIGFVVVAITAAAIGSRKAALASLIPYILVGGIIGHSNYLYGENVINLAIIAFITGLIFEVKNYNNTFKSRTAALLIIILILHFPLRRIYQVISEILSPGLHYGFDFASMTFWYAIYAVAVIAASALLPTIWNLTNTPIPSPKQKK